MHVRRRRVLPKAALDLSSEDAYSGPIWRPSGLPMVRMRPDGDNRLSEARKGALCEAPSGSAVTRVK